MNDELFPRFAAVAVKQALDDPLARDFADSDPTQLLRTAGPGMLVIDEVHRSPTLTLPLKVAVHRPR